ncbi:hypothetical protein OBBRIDRAFT_698863, partial [Obba rivulosa]
TYTPLTPPTRIWLGDKRSIPAIGTGNVKLNLRLDANRVRTAIVQCVYHVPEMNGNLLLVSRLTKEGYSIKFVGQGCHILKESGQIAGTAYKRGNLYILNAEPALQE